MFLQILICRTLHGYAREASQKFLRSFFQKATAPRPQAHGVSFVSFSLRLVCQRKAENDFRFARTDAFVKGFSPLFLSKKKAREKKLSKRERRKSFRSLRRATRLRASTAPPFEKGGRKLLSLACVPRASSINHNLYIYKYREAEAWRNIRGRTWRVSAV